MNNHLMAFDKYSGVPRWQVDSQSSRAVAVDLQYIYTFDNSTVVCREKDSGKRRWVYTPPNGARMQDRYNGIAVHHWYLCFTTYENTEKRGQLFTLNLPEGTYRWHFTFDSTGATWPTIANDVVYTCNGWGSQAKPNSKTGAVHGFDLSTGTRIFYDYSKRYIEQPIVANHRLMLICADRIKIFSNSPITGVNIEQDQTPAQYVLRQNYPNPFNASTTIEYELARAGFATLKVYNLLGETVATLFAEYRPAGKGKMVWDTRGLASGLYVYKLEAGDVVQIRKCIVMK
jgi:hypothetical protein